MNRPRLRWPTLLCDVAGFPAVLVGPLATNGLKTVADLVTHSPTASSPGSILALLPNPNPRH
jgi:hypothetical protein